MFIGHYGAAMAAKKVAPRTSLGMLVFAAQFLDLLWPILLLAGVEHVEIAPGITKTSPFNFIDYPISHSLLMTVVWAALVGGAYYALRRRSGVVIGLLVLSHWVLDFLMHRPDLQLRPGSETRVGLGLGNSLTATVVLEVVCFGIGLWLYTSSTRAKDSIGRYGFWSLMAVLFLGWVSTLLSGPPPNVASIGWGGLGMWLAVPWAWWADKHRELV